MKENWKSILVIAAVAIVLGIVATLTFADKHIDGYYLSLGSNTYAGQTSCVWSHWTWHIDERAYCSDDIDKVLRVWATIKGK